MPSTAAGNKPTGQSSLSVFQALCHLHHNEVNQGRRKNAPKFYVEDNVDPERMNALLTTIKLKDTCFNVITKSGSTSETMTQYLVIKDALEKAGLNPQEHIITTTSANSGNLIKIAKAEGYKTFYIPDGVGGRFSELCPVGLLPAAVLGIDIKQMLEGAIFTTCWDNNLFAIFVNCNKSDNFVKRTFCVQLNLAVLVSYTKSFDRSLSYIARSSIHIFVFTQAFAPKLAIPVSNKL